MTVEDYKLKILTQEQVDQYRRDGCLVLEDLLTAEEKKNIVTWCDEIQNWPETAGKWFQYFEVIDGKKTLCRTENFFHYHEGIKKMIQTKLSAAISDCYGEDACLFKEKINYKKPGGGGFPAHQDAPAYITFNQRSHMTTMIAANPMTRENGCLEVVRGVHEYEILKQAPDGSIHPDLVDSMNWEPIPCGAGAVMIFSSFIPHRSQKNNSCSDRRAFYLTFNTLSDGYFRDGYYADKREKFPPEIERVAGKDYSEGGKIYNLATPITNIRSEE